MLPEAHGYALAQPCLNSFHPVVVQELLRVSRKSTIQRKISLCSLEDYLWLPSRSVAHFYEELYSVDCFSILGRPYKFSTVKLT